MSGLYWMWSFYPVPPAVLYIWELQPLPGVLYYTCASFFYFLFLVGHLNFLFFYLSLLLGVFFYHRSFNTYERYSLLRSLSPDIFCLKRAQEQHLSLVQLPLVTPWQRGRFTPHQRALCQETACPEGLSNSRSHPNIVPGSAPPWSLWGSLWFCPSFSATA